ncbi:uncharacterized protein UDID_17245 [Ustilago sp. UG-2017a]|nr:uncharacterized protein UDID_17245 [Ustilago sp. UG-2017a]
MPPITCPVCSYAYAESNITNHLHKVHKGIAVSQDAAAAVGLVGCFCGQVVMNAAALCKHQGICKCQGSNTQQTQVQPTSAISTQQSHDVVSPEPAPVPGADMQHKSFLDVLDPAILAEENSNLNSISEAEPSVADSEELPLVLVEDNLDYVMAEAEAEASAQEAEVEELSDAEEEGETLPQLLELEPEPEPEPEPVQQPTPTPEPNLDLADVQDMPADGIVVLLPAVDAEVPDPQLVVPLPTRLLDNGREQEGAHLPRIPLLAPITNWNGCVEYDVDSFAVTISPADLLHIYLAGCYLSLCSHAPDFKDHTHTLFKDWVYFAELKVNFRFELQFKLPLIARLQQPPQRAILIPAEHASVLTYGELHVDVGIMVEALQGIGCQSIRMSAYGIKVPMDRFLDPAMLSEHPLWEANVFDIGCTVDTGHITLIAPKLKKGKFKQYPMALCVGRGFGSVELKWSYQPDGISHFKGYPKLTHLLKAGAAGAGQAGQPMSVKVVQDRISTLQSWKARIIGTAPEVGSGIRLEVTVQAATMQAAHENAVTSKYLDHLYLFSAAAGDQQLLTHTINKADMFTDLDALLAVAEQKQIFRGSHSKASTQLQRQAVIDLYNAMGWHPGRQPTALDSLTAWWASLQAMLDIAQELKQFSRANQFCICCNQCRNTLGTQKFCSHIAQLAVHNQLGVDLQALVVDPACMMFAAAPDDHPVQRLSQRRDLAGLEQGVEWLAEHRQPVEIHLGTQSIMAGDALLEKLGEQYAELTVQEEVLLLHGVAGAFNVSIGHMHLLRKSFTCQVIPVGSTGPYLGIRLKQLLHLFGCVRGLATIADALGHI